LAKELCGALGAILMIDSVKPVPTNSLSEPFKWTGINRRCIWQPAVKASVEHSHLENLADAFLDDLDPFQLGAIMQRCKSGHARYRRFHFWCDGCWFVQLFATVHDAMTYHVDF